MKRPSLAVVWFCNSYVCVGLTVVAVVVLIFIHKPAAIYGAVAGMAAAWRGNATLNDYETWRRAEVQAGRPVPARWGWSEYQRMVQEERDDDPITGRIYTIFIVNALLVLSSFVLFFVLLAAWDIFVPWLLLFTAASFITFLVCCCVMDARRRKRAKALDAR